MNNQTQHGAGRIAAGLALALAASAAGAQTPPPATVASDADRAEMRRLMEQLTQMRSAYAQETYDWLKANSLSSASLASAYATFADCAGLRSTYSSHSTPATSTVPVGAVPARRWAGAWPCWCPVC